MGEEKVVDKEDETLDRSWDADDSGHFFLLRLRRLRIDLRISIFLYMITLHLCISVYLYA